MTTRAERAAEHALEVLEMEHRTVHQQYEYGCAVCAALDELRHFLDEVIA